jgi:hypothetical protein
MNFKKVAKPSNCEQELKVPSEWGRLVVCSTRLFLRLCCRGGG